MPEKCILCTFLGIVQEDLVTHTGDQEFRFVHRESRRGFIEDWALWQIDWL